MDVVGTLDSASTLGDGLVSNSHVVVGMALLLFVAYLTWHFWTYGNNPGIPIYPIIGSIPAFSANFARLPDWIAETLDAVPSMSVLAVNPGQTDLFTANPQHLEHILKNNYTNFMRSMDGHGGPEEAMDLLGHSVITHDDELWRTQRKVASHEFSTNSLKQLVVDVSHSEVRERLLPLLDGCAASEQPVEMQEVLLRYTFDSICRVGFGHDPASLSPDFPAVPLATSFDHGLDVTLIRTFQPNWSWKIQRYFNVGPEKEMKKCLETIDSCLTGIIGKRAAEMAAVAAEGKELNRVDILSRMMTVEKDEKRLRDVCTLFLIAGRDTTAVTVSWFLVHMTEHPHVEQRILQEIEEVKSRRPGSEDPSVPSTPLSFDEIKQLNYTHAAINESLRLRSSVPLTTRRVVQDDTLPDGTTVKKGWRMTLCMYATGRMKQVWGPDVLEFKPERFLNADGTLKAISPFQFPVFLAGPHLCLGREMAYIQAKAVISSILPKYRLSVAPDYAPEYNISGVLNIKDGLKMLVHARSLQ